MNFIKNRIPSPNSLFSFCWNCGVRRWFQPDSLGSKCYSWPSAKEKEAGSGAITTASQNASLLLSEHITFLRATGPPGRCVDPPRTSRKSPLPYLILNPLLLFSPLRFQSPLLPLLAVCFYILASPAKGVLQPIRICYNPD